MTIYDHDPRNKIISASQHLYQHDSSDQPYTSDALPGVSNVAGALNWMVAVMYPNNQPAVANPAALPTVGNTLLDYRVVNDDGDGKAASYRWEQREGDATPKWYKIYDIDWGFDSVLAGFLIKTQDVYTYKHGYDDLDSSGAALTGINAGQHLFGGASANTHLTLHANAGDGTGAQTGYVQVTDNFRPTSDDTFECGTTGERWSKVWAHDAKIGTLNFDDNSITADGGTVDFQDDIITTGEGIFGGNIRINSSTITNPGNLASRQAAYCYGADSDYLTADGTDFNFDGTSDFTLAIWLNIQSKAGSTVNISRWGAVGDRCFIINYYSILDKIVFAVSADGTNKAAEVFADTFGSPALDTWNLVVARYVAGDGVYLSVNAGVEDYVAYAGSAINTEASVDFAIGGTNAVGAIADAYVANVGVWNRALTSYERLSLYNQGGGKEYSDLTVNEKVSLISYWNIDEFSDGTAPVTRVDSHASNDLTDASDTNSVLWSRTKGGGSISLEATDLTTSGTITAGSFSALTSSSEFASGTTVGNLTLANGSITDSSGAITFGNENLSTTGSFSCDNLTATGTVNLGTSLSIGTLTLASGSITDSGGSIDFGDEALSTTGTFGSGELTADNVRISGKIISTYGSNFDLQITANGSGVVRVGRHFWPTTADAYDIGGVGARFRSLYLSTSISDATNSITIANLLTFSAVGSPSAGDVLFWNAGNSRWEASAPDTEIEHSELNGITTDDAGHTQFALLAGRVGGQTLNGGTAASNNLTLDSTAHGTKGDIVAISKIRPNTDDSTDLGTTTRAWKDLYIKGQLIGARLANYTTGGRPSASASTIGLVIWNTTTQDIEVDGGGYWLKTSMGKWEFEDAVTWDGSTTTVTYTVDGSVSPERGRVSDARSCIWDLKDNTNSHKSIKASVTIDHPSATQVRVTVGAALPAGTYRLIGVG